MNQEQTLLLELYKKAKTAKESQRYHAILLVKTGSTVVYVSRIFFVDEETVRAWVKKWDEEKDVEDNPRSGKPPKLTKEQEQELVNLVDENNPQEHGYHTATWDCIELKKIVKDKFSIEISDETIRKLLKKYRFSYKKAEYLFSKRDLEKRNNFIAELFALYESLENTRIMFCDEMSTKLHPKLGYVWTRSDKVYVETNCSHKRISTIAAIEPIIGEKVAANYDMNNADSFVLFLEKLETSTDQNIVLVLDNYPVHHSRKVRDYLAKTGRITLKHLPTYSPDLNVIEWLWGYARVKYLNSRCSTTIEKLKEDVQTCFDSIGAEQIKKICNLEIIRKHLVT
ncbi:MAG: hypothetical protein FD167_5241 [bacterium]|nr:MAG: hypothetical protein FD167_5241 [bacterium]